MRNKELLPASRRATLTETGHERKFLALADVNSVGKLLDFEYLVDSDQDFPNLQHPETFHQAERMVYLDPSRKELISFRYKGKRFLLMFGPNRPGGLSPCSTS